MSGLIGHRGLLMGATSSAGAPLDGYTTNAWAAYSIVKMLSTYSGQSIRVRRDSDNTEQDIGFSGNSLDTASLATFVGSNSGFVTKWYDQLSLGHDATNITASKQPRIVNAGTYDAALIFDGVDDCLQTPNSSGTNTGMSLLLSGFLRSSSSPGGQGVWLESSSDGVANNTLSVYFDSSTSFQFHCGGPSNNYTAATVLTQSVQSYTLDRTASQCLNLYINGTLATPTGLSGSSSGSFSASPLNIGARNNSSYQTQLTARALVVYESALSGTDVAALTSRFTTAGL